MISAKGKKLGLIASKLTKLALKQALLEATYRKNSQA